MKGKAFVGGLVAGVLVASVGAVVASSVTENPDVIHGCRSVNNSLKMVDSNTCGSNEKYLSWNVKGEKGDPGLHGLQGAQGPEGPRGLQGERGVDGAPGLNGERGPQGERGPDGAPGQEGKEGPQGLKGDRGPDGERGPQGVQGPEGQQGPRGPAGPGFSSSSFYVATANISSDRARSITALCNTGDVAVGGSAFKSNGQPVGSGPNVTSGTPTGWTSASAGGPLTVMAICVDLTPNS